MTDEQVKKSAHDLHKENRKKYKSFLRKLYMALSEELDKRNRECKCQPKNVK